MNAHIAETPPIDSVRVLMSDLIDYAGLFPPSSVSMPEAVVNYATYQNSNYGWMLGRFILPVSRLDEFIDAARNVSTGDAPWRLSVLAGEDVIDSIRKIRTFNAEHGPIAVCDMIEVKATTVSKIENTVHSLPADIPAYFEISLDENLAELVATLAIKKQRAKIRTGGVTREDFPTSRDVIRFVRSCMAANVPFKATAGLHHPIRCYRPLTYAANAPQGTMHGFLNMLLMACFARESYRVGVLEELMEEEFEEVFVFSDGGVRWRNEHAVTTSQLGYMRKKAFHSFGSCSFDEPIADLRALGLL